MLSQHPAAKTLIMMINHESSEIEKKRQLPRNNASQILFFACL